MRTVGKGTRRDKAQAPGHTRVLMAGDVLGNGSVDTLVLFLSKKRGEQGTSLQRGLDKPPCSTEKAEHTMCCSLVQGACFPLGNNRNALFTVNLLLAKEGKSLLGWKQAWNKYEEKHS